MDNIFDELNKLKSKLDSVNQNMDSSPFPSDEHDMFADEAIEIVNNIGCLAKILHIQCESSFKAYKDVEIPLRMARGGKFYYGEEL